MYPFNRRRAQLLNLFIMDTKQKGNANAGVILNKKKKKKGRKRAI